MRQWTWLFASTVPTTEERREHVWRTIIDLIGLSPLLVDEDDGHQYDDLSHDPQEGP